MLDMTDSMEDVPASQDAKTLVPLSLSLVEKKEKILQAEAAKLEKLLRQRNEMICNLREDHEYLLTTNGQLQERRRLHREKLVSLRTLLGASPEANGVHRAHLCDAIGMNELNATAEKCGVLKEILLGLADKHAGLEQQCMGLEEQTSRKTSALQLKDEQLNEARSTIHLLHEDICSTQWNLEYNQAELTEEDKRLSIVSHNMQHESAMVAKIDTALRSEKSAVEDLQITWQNYEGMVHEEHRHLAIANEDATSEQRELQKLLRSNGATCPADEEVLQSAKNLQLRLQHVNEEVTNAKFFRRELALRRKQEQEWLAFTHSSIKAKDEQLNWLERQRVHLENEQKEAQKAHAADEAVCQAVFKEHQAAVTSYESQIRDAKKQLKAVEHAISNSNKKVAAVNKKVAQKSKVLAEWKTKVCAKQKQVAKSTATQELVVGEVLAVQDTLKQALLNVEHTQQLRSTQDMESEELHSSCAMLESEIQQTHRTLAALKHNIAAAQTAVKNRIDEIRDKFLSTFVVEDAKNLIELLSKEIANQTTKNTVKVDDSIASKTKMLKQRYASLSADTRKNYSKIFAQKQKQYDAKLNILKARTAEKTEEHVAVSVCEQRTGEEASSCEDLFAALPETNHKPGPDVSSKILPSQGSQELDPSWDERQINDGTASKVPFSEKCPSQPTQRKNKGVPILATKSVRRQLAPGLNLMDESPQTDKELIDVFTTDSVAVVATTKATKPSRSTVSRQRRRNTTKGVRQPRLKRRTPAQKAGKRVETASITPEAAISVSISSAISSAQPDSAVKISSQGSLDSPIGCDDDLGAPRSAPDVGDSDSAKQTSDTSASFAATQAVARKPQLQKMGPHSKNTIKRHTSTKVSHRSRHTKAKSVSRISLGRSQAGLDWSAADSFSFD